MLKKNLKNKYSYTKSPIVVKLLTLAFLAAGASAAPLKMSGLCPNCTYFIVDEFGNQLSHLRMDFGTVVDSTPNLNVVSRKLYLKSTKEVQTSEKVYPSLGSCSIDRKEIPQSNFQVTINNRKFISTFEAMRGFEIQVSIFNSARRNGTLICEDIKVYVD